MNCFTPKLVTTTYRHHGLPVVTGDASIEISATPLCQRFIRDDLSLTLRAPCWRANRLSCRFVRPSPCPTHYGGRSATMPSADFCPITPSVTAGRAARVTVGSGGVPNAFALDLSPAPMATKAPLGFVEIWGQIYFYSQAR